MSSLVEHVNHIKELDTNCLRTLKTRTVRLDSLLKAFCNFRDSTSKAFWELRIYEATFNFDVIVRKVLLELPRTTRQEWCPSVAREIWVGRKNARPAPLSIINSRTRRQTSFFISLNALWSQNSARRFRTRPPFSKPSSRMPSSSDQYANWRAGWLNFSL